MEENETHVAEYLSGVMPKVSHRAHTPVKGCYALIPSVVYYTACGSVVSSLEGIGIPPAGSGTSPIGVSPIDGTDGSGIVGSGVDGTVIGSGVGIDG
jgi:hypothetical protein